MDVNYVYLDDQRRERVDTWSGNPMDALAKAIEYLQAKRSDDDDSEHIYYDHASGTWWVSNENDLIRLGAALLARGDDRGDIYSLWCAGHSAREWKEGRE